MGHVKGNLNISLRGVKGIGDARAELLQSELGLRTVGDLLWHFPFRYVDRSRYHTVAEAVSSVDYAQIRGVLGTLREGGHGRRKWLKSTFKDNTGQLELVWFKGLAWIRDSVKPGAEYIIYGKVTTYKGTPSMAHPEMVLASSAATKGYFQPIYGSTEKLTKRGLGTKGIEKIIRTLLDNPSFVLVENLPGWMREEFRLPDRTTAMRMIHSPKVERDAFMARRRLKFEELFFLQLELLLRKNIHRQKAKGYVLEEVGDHFNRFYSEHLPFDLTGAQKRVMKEIRKDLKSGAQMNRLLQGDVGSGKTMVAALASLIAIDNGFQAAVMAPTEILATQHMHTFGELFAELPLRVELLTGSTKKAKRDEIHRGLQNGEVNLLVGTHAIIQKSVKFHNLGLAIVDEQHRFGVAQRAQLWSKNKLPPHVLVMTATPIPRTLAMTLYGDLDVSVIDEMPPGRKPVKTTHVYDDARLRIFGFMEDQIKKGRQVYVVYPLIEESETLDLKDLMDGYESIVRRFPLPEYQISIVHGRMKAEDKDWEMNRFVKGETQIMVATTVIEVGVNVPNATVMVIESAQRFGLSQLHQLRGRVGRGAELSHCILVSDKKLSSEARTRLKTMTETNDGFRIAEVDLELRGPGEIMGTKQSGDLNLKLANLATDGRILTYARETARNILEEDPELSMEKHREILEYAKTTIFKKPNWSRIS